MEEIDFERVVNDPVYRRKVIDRLNAEVRRNGEARENRAVRREEVETVD